MNYIFLILTLISIYSLLALSLNLQVGYTGLLSLCHAAFYGAGAYIYSLILINFNVHFITASVLAILCVMLLSLVISLPTLKLKDDYFILASLGFQFIVFSIIYNWDSVTNGSYGLNYIPHPNIFGITISSKAGYLFFCLIVSSFCVCLIYLLYNSPFGRVLKAIREDSISTEALGKPVFQLKLIVNAIAAGFAAVAGILYTGYSNSLDPRSFTLDESIFILSIVIIGGTGNFIGPLLGAIFLVILPEILREFVDSSVVAASIRQIIYGLLIIILMRYRPQGIWGEFQFK